MLLDVKDAIGVIVSGQGVSEKASTAAWAGVALVHVPNKWSGHCAFQSISPVQDHTYIAMREAQKTYR